MSIYNRTKINKLINAHPPEAVLLAGWLSEHGYSLELQKRYRKSGWFESIGAGAMIRAGRKASYEGAIYALQKQAGGMVHPAGRTALALHGKAHYLELAAKHVTLFGGARERLPKWFQEYDWGVEIDYYPTSFLPPEAGLVEFNTGTVSINVSSPVRAMMECLYLAPKKQDLVECAELMEGLNNLRPQAVQKLLEQCTSVKVKRLFLYLAEKAGHEWAKYLDLSKVDLGNGKRALVKGGEYVTKYQMTVPKELYSPYKYLINNQRRLLEVFKGGDEALLNQEIPYLRDAWIRRDGAIAREISVFFAQLLSSNPGCVMKIFAHIPEELEAWLEGVPYHMFTGLPEEAGNLAMLRDKILVSLRGFLDAEISAADRGMATKILRRVEDTSLRMID